MLTRNRLLDEPVSADTTPARRVGAWAAAAGAGLVSTAALVSVAIATYWQLWVGVADRPTTTHLVAKLGIAIIVAAAGPPLAAALIGRRRIGLIAAAAGIGLAAAGGGVIWPLLTGVGSSAVALAIDVALRAAGLAIVVLGAVRRRQDVASGPARLLTAVGVVAAVLTAGIAAAVVPVSVGSPGLPAGSGPVAELADALEEHEAIEVLRTETITHEELGTAALSELAGTLSFGDETAEMVLVNLRGPGAGQQRTYHLDGNDGTSTLTVAGGEPETSAWHWPARTSAYGHQLPTAALDEALELVEEWTSVETDDGTRRWRGEVDAERYAAVVWHDLVTADRYGDPGVGASGHLESWRYMNRHIIPTHIAGQFEAGPPVYELTLDDGDISLTYRRVDVLEGEQYIYETVNVYRPVDARSRRRSTTDVPPQTPASPGTESE